MSSVSISSAHPWARQCPNIEVNMTAPVDLFSKARLCAIAEVAACSQALPTMLQVYYSLLGQDEISVNLVWQHRMGAFEAS